MVLSLLLLFILVQSPTRSSAIGLLKHGKVCGTVRISRSDNPNHELFYIDEKLVNRDLFCEVLKEYHGRHCFLAKLTRDQYCNSLDKSPSLVARKSLKVVVGEGHSKADNDKIPLERKDKYEGSILKSKMLVVAAVPTFFLLCCALLCPCIQARKRNTEHAILSKDPHSSSPNFFLLTLGHRPLLQRYLILMLESLDCGIYTRMCSVSKI